MSAAILTTALTISYFLSLVGYLFSNVSSNRIQIILLWISMAYFRLSLLASGKVTELEVQSSSFIQLKFIDELFLSFIGNRHFTRRADEFSMNSKNNLILPECVFATSTAYRDFYILPPVLLSRVDFNRVCVLSICN